MSVPIINKFIEPVFASINELGGSASNNELERQVIDKLGLNFEQLGETDDDYRNKFNYRLSLALVYLKIFGVIEKSCGNVWSLTPHGCNMETVSAPDVIQYFKEYEKRARKEGLVIVDLEELKWHGRILNLIKWVPDSAFNKFCKHFLRESGFTRVNLYSYGNYSLRGKGFFSLNDVISFPVYFLFNRSERAVYSQEVCDFRNELGSQASHGLIITTGTFSGAAREEAVSDSSSSIQLIDGQALVRKLKNLGLGIIKNKKFGEEVKVDEHYFGSLQ